MTDATKDTEMSEEHMRENSREDGKPKEGSDQETDGDKILETTDTRPIQDEQDTPAETSRLVRPPPLPEFAKDGEPMEKRGFKTPPPTMVKSRSNGDVIFNKSKGAQTVIESLRSNKIVEENLYRDKRNDSANFRILPVDWLGLPLSTSTLPDFISTTKLHYRRPVSAFTPQQHQRTVPTLRIADDLSKTGQSFHDQFLDVAWVPTDPSPPKISGGYSKKDGQIAEILPHPKTSIWHIPETLAERIKKKDPMEYLNLLDPRNVIPTEKAIYQWLIRDQGEVGLEVTIGESVKSSGYSQNRIPYLPELENRDLLSVYKKSFCLRPERNDVEGLISLQHRDLNYPGYGGSATMRDFPSSFERFGPNLLKTKPDFTKGNYRRVKSARPIL